MAGRESAASRGVEDAWDAWLAQHDISVPMLIEDAVHKAFGRWLAGNRDELVKAIAEAVAEKPN